MILPGHGAKVFGILGVDAQLDRVTARLAVLGVIERERLARGDPDLLAHEIEAGDQLGHRVLDLEARVHLHEVEAAVGVEQVLHRADVRVADRLDRLDRRGLHLLARRLGQRGARRLFDHLLVAALDRALALAEVRVVAVLVADDLDLDVARLLAVPLHEHLGIAERGLRLGAAHRPRLEQLLLLVDDLHAATTAAGARLEDHGEADALGRLEQL